MRTLVALLVLLAAPVASAQDGPAPPTPAALAADLTLMLTDRVGLTDAQTARVRPVLLAHADRVVPLIPEGGGVLTLLRARRQIGRVNRETDAVLRPLLTAAQRERYGGFLDDAMDHIRRRLGD